MKKLKEKIRRGANHLFKLMIKIGTIGLVIGLMYRRTMEDAIKDKEEDKQDKQH